jgi:hypothetical protein
LFFFFLDFVSFFSLYLHTVEKYALFTKKGGTMSQTRREFLKDIAVGGAAITTGTVIVSGEGKAEETAANENSRCPYFDQPMYCKDLTPDGKPMCDQQ